ncbi:MAG: hypothetical protein R2708_12615 [Vicinamibacterales bacterium]
MDREARVGEERVGKRLEERQQIRTLAGREPEAVHAWSLSGFSWPAPRSAVGDRAAAVMQVDDVAQRGDAAIVCMAP